MAAMEEFLISYEDGRKKGHYISGALPKLSIPDNSFDLSLSSHFLFLHSENLDYKFHYETIKEMLRVSLEARIFPLLDVNAEKSKHLEEILSAFDSFKISIRKVDYEFQIGGNEMLVVSRKMS